MKGIVISGIPGVGKSVFIQKFKQYAEAKNCTVMTYEEPIKEWMIYESKSGNVYEPLKMRYDSIDDPIVENSFATFILLSLINQRNNKAKDSDIAVYERGYHDCKLFRPIDSRYRKCIDMVYDYVEDNFGDNQCIYVYLSCTVDTSIERIKKRGRDAEMNIDPSYLNGLLNKHDEWFKDYITFDMNVDVDSEAYQSYIIHLFSLTFSK